MRKKYFFFDIDGTLTDIKTNKVVPSAKETLHLLEANGHFVAIATGRAHYKAVKTTNELGIYNLVCAGGGALVKDNQLIQNKPLDKQLALALIHQAEDLGIGILLMLDDSIKVYAKDDLFIQQVGQRQEPTEYIIDPQLDYNQLDNIYKIYLSVSQDDEKKLTLLKTLGYLRFVKEYLIIQYDAKDQGIIDMMNYLHAPLEDVVVFGDDYNDLVMFNEQWTSIAMGNACDALKEKASYVTDLNINDGILKACQKFKWI